MTPGREVLDVLERADTVLLRLAWRDGGGACRTGRGRGRVRTERVGPTELILRDAGSWKLSGTWAVRFGNATRFTVEDGVVKVAHLRRGPAYPVPLVELAPTGNGRLIARSPHRCGEDLYAARLRIARGAANLAWLVRGPGKTQRLHCRYLASDLTGEPT